IPRGPDRCGSLSGIVGTPVESEKRTVTGVDGLPAWGARVSVAAAGDGVNVPEHINPLAWAGRKPGCSPDSASRAPSNCSARAKFVYVPAGMRTSLEGKPYWRDERCLQAPRRTRFRWSAAG